MPRVDFYLIAENQPHARLVFASRLIEKAYHLNHRIYVNTSSTAESHALDTLLWVFREESFIPHAIYTGSVTTSAPIQIGNEIQKLPEDQHDILINLSEAIPTFYTDFQRVIEIVLNEPQHQAKSRERFRLYREQDCQLDLHDLREPKSDKPH
jgi:DNA polymerase-3 subunit chi